MPTRYENRMRQAEAHFRLYETATGYTEKTGRAPSFAQLKYWGRGGKKYRRVTLENIARIRRYSVSLARGWFRYTLVARVSGTDSWKREYYVEWKLVYHRQDKRPFTRGIDKERVGARYALEKLAHKFKTHVPDGAVTSAEPVQRNSDYKPGDPAFFSVRDNKRLEEKNIGGILVMAPYEFIEKVPNHEVLKLVDEAPAK